MNVNSGQRLTRNLSSPLRGEKTIDVDGKQIEGVGIDGGSGVSGALLSAFPGNETM